MATVKEIYRLLDRKAPFRYQMDFDNAGFLVGRGDREVTRALVALDITPAVIREAAALCGGSGHLVRDYDLSNSRAATLGMVCGGHIKVLLEPLGVS